MSSVLLVDDSPTDRALFRTILMRSGFEVHEVSYGRDVPSRALEARPHVIVLDVNLPDTNGHAVCRGLRADPKLVGIPILMLTVRDNEADVLAGLEAGADDYVAKDAAPEIFLARVRRLVRYRQLATLALLNEQLVQVGRLLAGIVHEIRGPLSVIRGNAELMRMMLGTEHQSNRWLDPIVRNAQILQTRLEHLMAAVRSGPPVLRPVEVGPLVRETTDLFRKGLDPQSQVQVEVGLGDRLPIVRADAGRLMQVLLNLLTNAHEAIVGTGPRGRIAVAAESMSDREGEWVKVEVRDSGPGIPETHLGRIFEPFFTTKPEGSGYGLYLANEILREHGGRLTACNSDDGGACVAIWLPTDTSRPEELTLS
jgi:signal transduction histidine kinase